MGRLKMKAQIKAILIISLLSGIIISQELTGNSTSPSEYANSPSSSAPSGSASGSGKGPRPYGKGKWRGSGGKRPDGPKNMPPKEGGYSDKIANITDEKLYQVKNVLKFL